MVAAPARASWGCASRCGRVGLRARVGLRELRWGGGRLRLNGRPLVLRGASIHEDAAGRGDALRGRHGRGRGAPAGDRRQRHARPAPARPGAARAPRRRGDPRVAGRRPGRRPGAWTSTTPARRARAERRVRLSVLQLRAHPSVLTWNLANEVAFNGHAGGQAAYVPPRRARCPPGPGPPGRARRLGHAPAERRRRRLAPRRRGRRDELRGLVRAAGRLGRRHARRDRRLPARLHRLLRRQGRWPSPSSAPRPTARTPRRAPAASGTRRDCWPTHIAAYRADPRLDGMLVWNLQDFALPPRFDGGSIRGELPDIRLRARHQPEGPVHLRRPAEAGAALAVARAFSGRPR